MSQRQFVLDSGRAVGVSACGDPLARRLVLFFHPTPGAGSFDPLPTVTSNWGVQLIALDRPGYAGSDPLSVGASASIQGVADDAALFLASLEHIAQEISHGDYGRVGLVGWGTGGAVALSLAARHPELIDRVAVVALRKPTRLEDELRARASWRQLPSVFDTSPADFLPLLSVPDIRAARETLFADPAVHGHIGLDNRVERMVADAFASGPAGVASDLAAARNASWAAELGRITAGTVLIYGDHDDITAQANGHWYRARIKDARVAIVEGAGRLTIAAAWRRILSHVAPEGTAALGTRLPSG